MQTSGRVVRAASVAALAIAFGIAGSVTAAEPVTRHIPDGAMGYILINNVDKTMNGVEAFMKDIGVGQMFGPQPGAEPDTPPLTLMLMVRTMLKLGNGFNPNGGFAAVMLDPADFGIDPMEMFGLAPPAAAEADMPPKPRPLPPVVLLVAGTGVSEVFGAYKPQADGGMWQMELGGMPVFAMQIGGYLALGPNKEAVLAIGKAGKKPVETGMDPAAVAVANRGDLVLHLNMTKVMPLLTKLMPMVQQAMGRAGPAEKEVVELYLGIYQDLLKQFKSVTMSVRLTGDGIAIETHVAAVPGTAMAKSLTSQVGVRGGVATLNALPSLPYALAIGVASAANPDGAAASLEMVDKILKAQALNKVSDDLKARTRQFISDYSDQFTGVQAVIGGAPANNGVFGVAYLLRCRDAAKGEKFIPEYAALIEAYIKALIEDKDAQQLRLVHTKGAETIEGKAVDVLDVQHPELDKMKEEERANMKKALGEDKIRIRWVVAAKDTVIVTFGGGQAMMAEALKVAAGKGPIPTAPGTAVALKHLPPNSSVLLLLNVANTLDAVRAGMAAFGMPEEAVAEIPKLQCQVPISLGGQSLPNGLHAVGYIPTELVKEVVPVFMKMGARERPKQIEKEGEKEPPKEPEKEPAKEPEKEPAKEPEKEPVTPE